MFRAATENGGGRRQLWSMGEVILPDASTPYGGMSNHGVQMDTFCGSVSLPPHLVRPPALRRSPSCQKAVEAGSTRIASTPRQGSVPLPNGHLDHARQTPAKTRRRDAPVEAELLSAIRLSPWAAERYQRSLMGLLGEPRSRSVTSATFFNTI